MAARSCFQRLLATASSASLRRAPPACSSSAACNLASVKGSLATGRSHGELESCGGVSIAGYQFVNKFHLSSNPTCSRANSLSTIDGGSRTSAFVYIGDDLITLGKKGPLNSTEKGLGLHILAGMDMHDKSIMRTRCFTTKSSSPQSSDVVVIQEGAQDQENEPKKLEPKKLEPKTLEDFQHEEIVGPTVERDLSPVAHELRESFSILQKRIVSFQKSLFVLGCVQGVGAVWCYASWHSLNPTWLLLPTAVLSFMLAFVLRQALQPIAFFGNLEGRSRLRIVTLSLMVSKGFASFFNRARILVGASAVGLVCTIVYFPSTYLLSIVGIFK